MDDITKTKENGHYEGAGFVWWLYLEDKQSKEARVVSAILRDLTNRRGLGHEFNGCDDDTKKEIVDTWLGIVAKEG